MRRCILKACLTVVLVLFVLSLVQDAEAIPTFARKYRTSCNTCHVAIPKRNAFGDAFRRNGFHIPGGDAAYVKEEPVSLGAEAWKKVWPETVWPGFIPQTVPISFYAHQRFFWQENGSPDTGFDAPHELELVLGGNFGERVSFFGEWLVFEKGKVDEGRLGALYVQFNDLLFNTPDLLNLKVGRFETGASRGFKDDNRLTLEHPMPYDYTVSGGGADKSLRTKQSGIELNGILSERFEYALGIVNGNGSTADNNSQKDGFYRFGYKFGGMGLDGSGGEPEEELVQKDNWRDDSFTIGTFGYFGQPSENEDYRRFGVDLRLLCNRFDVGAAVVFGEDDVSGGSDIDSSSFFADVQYLFYPWLIGLLRYEQKDFDNAADIGRIIASLNILQRANLRWTLEGVFFPQDSDGNDTLKANFQFAF